MSKIQGRQFLKYRTIFSLLLALTVFSLGLSFTSEAAAGSWAGWDSMDTIAILSTSDEYLDTASQELKKYLDEMSDRSWTIVHGDTAHPAIRLDVNPGSDNLTDRGDEAVELLCDNNGIRITGKTSLATRHGSYILLEKLGYRYYFKHPAWEVVPSTLVDLGPINEIHEPRYWYRSIGIGRPGAGRPLEMDWKNRNLMVTPYSYPMGHNYSAIVRQSYGSEAALFAIHPDWFLPDNWDGVSWEAQLNGYEPGVLDMALVTMRAYLDNPDNGAAPITPNDGNGWTPPDRTNQEITDIVMHLSNEVAKVAAIEYPDKPNYVNVYCYSRYSGVPTFDLEPNLMVQITTGFNYSGMTLNEQIDAYISKGATVAIRDYMNVWSWWHDGPDHRDFNLNLIKDSASKINAYNTEATDGWGATGLAYYTGARLLRDPSLDIQTIRDEFYVKAFGPASALMKHVYQDLMWGDYRNYETMNQVFLAFAEAETLAAGDDKILERIRQLELYWRFVWKWQMVGIINLSDSELMDFYTFVTKLDTLYLIQQHRVEADMEAELTSRGLTGVVDRIPPTIAETVVYLADGLAAFPSITAPLPNPLGVSLVPLSADTLVYPRLQPLTGREKTILVQTTGNEDITVTAWTRGRLRMTWYDPMGLQADEFCWNSSAPMPPTDVVFHTVYPGEYLLHVSGYNHDATVEILGRSCGMLAHPGLDLFTNDQYETYNAPFVLSSYTSAGPGLATEQYFYVPAGTPSFIIGVQVGSNLSGPNVGANIFGTLTDPNGITALDFSELGTDPTTQTEWQVDSPMIGVWQLTIDLTPRFSHGYFWFRDILPLVWHDAEYLLISLNSPTVLNSPPVANNQSVTTNEDTPLSINLSAYDQEGDTLTYAIVTGLSHGSLSGTLPAVTYTPIPNFNDFDKFSFLVNDGAADSNIATINITVNPVNDPPVADDQSLGTDEDTLLSVTLTASDVDNDPLTFSVVSGPTHGTLSGAPPNLTYTPDANYSILDSFTFKANDGVANSNTATVSIAISPNNDPPVANDDYATTYEE
ncbi:DUF4838 domain-containing protein, partial [Chloroflexota bacterium]